MCDPKKIILDKYTPIKGIVTGPNSRFRFSLDGKMLSHCNPTIHNNCVLSTKDGKRLFPLRLPYDMTCMDVGQPTKDTHRIAYGKPKSPYVYVYDTNRREALHPLMDLGILSEPTSIRLSPCSKFCIAAFDDNKLRVWDMSSSTTPIKRFNLEYPVRYPSGIALSDDCSVCAATSLTPIVSLWNIKQNRPKQELKGHAGRVISIDFIYDETVGLLCTTISHDNTIRVWDTKDGGCIGEIRLQSIYDRRHEFSFKRKNPPVLCCGYIGDRPRCITERNKKQANVLEMYELRTARHLLTLSKPPPEVDFAALRPGPPPPDKKRTRSVRITDDGKVFAANKDSIMSWNLKNLDLHRKFRVDMRDKNERLTFFGEYDFTPINTTVRLNDRDLRSWKSFW